MSSRETEVISIIFTLLSLIFSINALVHGNIWLFLITWTAYFVFILIRALGLN